MTVVYSIIQFLFWFSYGAVVNFSSVYLLQCGLSNTSIGIVSSVACALSVVVQPILASYADRDNSISLKAILLCMCMSLLGFGGILFLFYGKGIYINGIILGCAILIVQTSLPFFNALATEMINAGKNINFSISRGIGSIGYAVMSFSVGKLTAAYGAGTLPCVVIGSTVLLIVALFLFPFEKEKHSRQEPKSELSLIAFAQRYPAFCVILAGCVLIYTSHVLINNFVYQIITYKGGTSEHMGIVMALAGILEIISMFMFSKLLKWKDCSFWFRISGIFFTLKALGTLLADSIGSLYIVQMLQPMGWGLMTVSSVYFVNMLMEERDTIKGQAYMTMSLSVGTIIGSLIGGWLIDMTGIPGMLSAAVICGTAGTCIVMYMTRRTIHMK